MNFLIHHLPIGLLALDAGYKVLSINECAARILGFNDLDQALGMPFTQLVNWSSLPKIEGFLRSLDQERTCLSERPTEWEMSFTCEKEDLPIRLWGHMADGTLHIALTEVPTEQIHLQNVLMGINTEMTNLHRELNRKQHQLQMAHEKIKEMNFFLEQKNQAMEKDLLMAQIVQKSLLSKMVKRYDKVALKSTYTPAESVGGDLYDMLVLDQDHVGIFICDVTGHGVASALVMAVIKNIFRTHAPLYRRPHELLDAANKEFIGLFEGTDMDLYATAFYIILDLKNDLLYYSGAGHPAPELYHKESPSESLYDPSFPIGMLSHDTYSSKKIPLVSGDRLFLFTDGLEPYLSENGDYHYDLKAFSWGNIITCFHDLSEKVTQDAKEQADDVCILIVEYNVKHD